MSDTDASTEAQSEEVQSGESGNGAVRSELPDAVTKDPEDQQGLVKLKAVYESLRFGEYDIRWGIAEFADNSLDNDANNVWAFIEETEKEIGGKELEVVGEVAVVDDGTGMTREEIEGCLILGESFSPGSGGDRPIGRFGVGMTMAAISMARRVEVYSRTSGDEPFRHVYLDLDEVQKGSKKNFDAEEEAPPEKYSNLLEGKAGTVVLLRKCDRLQHDPAAKNGIRASKQAEGVETFLGRVYRKFISAGRRFWYNGNKVYLHDPLYMDGPTYFDAEKPGGPDRKANQVGNTIEIPVEVPGSSGEEKTIQVKVSLLPEEWRDKPGRGGEKFARERKIHQNEGISILRADREVLYGKVPYLIGVKGQSKYNKLDRWWGLEISFPPELDDYFEVRYIKRGAQPVSSVRDKIRDRITDAIMDLREDIREHWADERREESSETDAFTEAEEAMADVEDKLPASQRSSGQDGDDADEKIDDLVDEDETTDDEDESAKEKRKEEIKDKPYAIVPVKTVQSVFFEPEFLPGKIVIKLNTEHPFYKQVFAPLCGNIAAVEEGDELRHFVDDGETEKQRLARKALLLLLFSHSKAESMFNDKELTSTFENLRTWWGTTLGSALSE